MKFTDPGSTTGRPLSPSGHTLRVSTPGSVSGYLPPNVASFVCSLSRKACDRRRKDLAGTSA
jgi:hypothetical protein